MLLEAANLVQPGVPSSSNRAQMIIYSLPWSNHREN